MNNLVSCQRCKKSFIEEEYPDHSCSPITTRLQEIGLDQMYGSTINNNGDTVYMAKGLNGIMYRLVQCSHNPTHTNLHPTTFDSEEIRRRFDRALFYIDN